MAKQQIDYEKLWRALKVDIADRRKMYPVRASDGYGYALRDIQSAMAAAERLAKK